MNYKRKEAIIKKYSAPPFSDHPESIAGAIVKDYPDATNDDIEDILAKVKAKPAEEQSAIKEPEPKKPEGPKPTALDDIPKAEIAHSVPTQQRSLEDKQDWFDVFEARPVKKSFTDPLYPTEKRVFIIAFDLGKRLRTVKIERHLVVGNLQNPAGFNSFCAGWDAGHGGGLPHLYLPKGQAKNGDMYPYSSFVKMMGIDPKKDISMLLQERYPELADTANLV